MIPAPAYLPHDLQQPLPPAWATDRIARWIDASNQADDAIERARFGDPVGETGKTPEEIQAEVEAENIDRGRRRVAELELADYIEHGARYHPIENDLYGFDGLVDSMRRCRQSGTFGYQDGGWVMQWDHKCGQVRLCPDEARGESRRVSERYVPAMLEWKRAKPGRRRLFFCVLTTPNVPTGELEAGKRAAFQRFREILFGKADACPVEFDRIRPRDREPGGPAHQAVRPNRCRTMRRFPSIQGAHVTQEDPLSAHVDWNVHLNAVLLVEGELSFKRLRDEWGYQLEIREIRGTEAAIRSALVEAVKYAALAVPAKAAEKRAEGASAPAMVEWPFECFLEWWAAGNGFRRSRALGCLYNTPKPEGELQDLVRAVGRIRFDGHHYQVTVAQRDAGGRCVDSIPMENNFRTSGPTTGPDPPTGRRARPPGAH